MTVKCNFCSQILTRYEDYSGLSTDVIDCETHIVIIFENKVHTCYQYIVENNNDFYKIVSTLEPPQTELYIRLIDDKNTKLHSNDLFQQILSIPRFMELELDENNKIKTEITLNKLKSLLIFS